MTATVVSIFKCDACGGRAKRVDVEFQGEVRATINACEECLARTREDLKAAEPLFAELLRWGVSRAAANAMMTSLLDHDEFKAGEVRAPNEGA